MKIIVTGGYGQLGRAFVALADSFAGQMFFFSSCDLNVTIPYQVNRLFNQIRPDVVIHTGAYTAVDAAETAQDEAFRVNVAGTRNIAAACLNHDSKMVYLSSDYVFDGKQNLPYTEFDQPNPINVYGRSKLEGELIAARICPRLFIIRTSWLYGEGRNFVRTILKLAQERKELTVVNDQIGTPTYTADLAQGIMSIIETGEFGTYHMSNNGYCTWYDFAKEILRLAGLSTGVQPITTSEFAATALRPRYSVLRNYMLELSGGDYFRCWQDALADYINRDR
ncbi:dTDP-4-dehydrorhamnose reductase [Sporomusa malonica]|uniref:dTDP-4-dehydrorhamnose reductase n=1 Tax=Sporomusa malonica TaxID=112901 RepID=A0A1W2EUZ7_9FIRM|nr:dTDP-4-dehydrorhamnose reductase [Sporomusa malonica]SMD13412.1 dTDP-4-dehydrorhamnose reductase [Sporomusa malonica]